MKLTTGRVIGGLLAVVGGVVGGSLLFVWNGIRGELFGNATKKGADDGSKKGGSFEIHERCIPMMVNVERLSEPREVLNRHRSVMSMIMADLGAISKTCDAVAAPTARQRSLIARVRTRVGALRTSLERGLAEIDEVLTKGDLRRCVEVNNRLAAEMPKLYSEHQDIRRLLEGLTRDQTQGAVIP